MNTADDSIDCGPHRIKSTAAMTPPADKPMDRSEAVKLARWWLNDEPHYQLVTTKLARAVLEMDEELRKAAESGKEKP